MIYSHERQKFGVCKIFYGFKISLIITMAAFIWSKYSKNSNIVNYYFNLK